MTTNEFSVAFSTAFDAEATTVPPTPVDSSVRTAPCNWPVSYSACGPCIALENSTSSKTIYEEMAATFLWAWTGHALGVCPVVLRPCGPQCWDGQSTWAGTLPSAERLAAVAMGVWYGTGCSRCHTACSCGSESTIRLGGPVDSVTAVTVDGVALDPSAYRIENRQFLVRHDGYAWPQCGLEVSYAKGIPVPIGGQVAAGILACEFAKAATRDSTCALPQRIQNITRQGVTVTLMDDFSTLQDGMTGIWLVDSWVASMTKVPTRSSVRSPDIRPPRVTTWQA